MYKFGAQQVAGYQRQRSYLQQRNNFIYCLFKSSLNTIRYMVLMIEYMALMTEYMVLMTENMALMTEHIALMTQYMELMTEYMALMTIHGADDTALC
jgi:hypothetical protein